MKNKFFMTVVGLSVLLGGNSHSYAAGVALPGDVLLDELHKGTIISFNSTLSSQEMVGSLCQISCRLQVDSNGLILFPRGHDMKVSSIVQSNSHGFRDIILTLKDSKHTAKIDCIEGAPDETFRRPATVADFQDCFPQMNLFASPDQVDDSPLSASGQCLRNTNNMSAEPTPSRSSSSAGR